jgi:hypothetical protein
VSGFSRTQNGRQRKPRRAVAWRRRRFRRQPLIDPPPRQLELCRGLGRLQRIEPAAERRCGGDGARAADGTQLVADLAAERLESIRHIQAVGVGAKAEQHAAAGGIAQPELQAELIVEGRWRRARGRLGRRGGSCGY